MRKIFSHCHVLFFGAGGTKGGVKKLSLNKNWDEYKSWALSEGTRNILGELYHVLIPEYFIRLNEKREKLEKWQEVHLRDPSGDSDFTNSNKSSFVYALWRKKYSDELDTAQEFHERAKNLDETVSLLSCLCKESSAAEMPNELGQKEGILITSDEKELLPLVEQDKDDLLDQLRSMKDVISTIISRRLEKEDLIGSSSRVWKLSVSGKAGGEEARLFAEDLAEILKEYCTTIRGWKVTMEEEGKNGSASSSVGSTNSSGGNSSCTLSEGIMMTVEGDCVYRYLHHEIGVHKVQRIPVTDASGKMQTSTAVVKLMPILDPVSVQVYESDCKIDFVRGSGPGGQGMQSSSNCVVLVHLPSGISVKCHQSRSALGNKELALQMVAQELLVRRVKSQSSSVYDAWTQQWSSGERSDKMRTYNFPQNRVTDHRLGKDYPLDQFMNEGKGLMVLHDELNHASDLQELSTTLMRHINGKFGSEP